MALLGIVAVIAIAYLVFTQYANAQSDTVDDLGGYVDQSATSQTVRIAQAIATAEGFYSPGSRPARNHNPGDMTSDLIGKSIGMDGPFVVFITDADGWNNLYAQVNAYINGTSRYHSSSSSISDLAGLGSETGYTATDQEAWANTVAQTLGVSVDTPLGQV